MYECRGRSGEVSLGYAGARVTLTQVGLAGHELGPSSGVLAVKPWQVATIKFERLVE